MFDLVCIFTTGGVILFYKAFCVLKFDIIDSLIKKVLIQEKSSQYSYTFDPYTVKWKLANEFKLIFAVVYQELFHLSYVEELLELMRENYIKTIVPNFILSSNIFKSIPSFEDKFEETLRKWEERKKKDEKKASLMRSFDETKKGKEVTQKKEKDPTKKISKTNTVSNLSQNMDSIQPNELKKKNSQNDIELTQDEIERNRSILAAKFKKQSSKKEEKETPAPEPSKKTKAPTDWMIPKTNLTSQDLKKIDHSKQEGEVNDEAVRKMYLGGEDEKIKGFVDDDIESSESDDETSKKPQKSGLFSRLTNGIKNITGNKVITNEDLMNSLIKFKEDLMTKNVAEEISQKLCDSIRVNLVDKKTEAFTSLSKTIKKSLEESLTKILTPKKTINIISEALKKKESGSPYVLTFIGVNGVGKSTNLAKVAYLFKKEGFSVMLAACDNFRAGAVEQIKTHGRCLEIPVYDRGYKEDPAMIAQKAIKEAKEKKIDVVLIDTAGRMQDNEPLMKALSRLIVLNQPDLVIFIGEALTGNDASDQLMKFNKAIIDLSPKENIREIDAIILSKFDTVDEKVGTAISLTYLTGKPILFCGVGQKYTHLRKLNVKTVVNALLS